MSEGRVREAPSDRFDAPFLEFDLRAEIGRAHV